MDMNLKIINAFNYQPVHKDLLILEETVIKLQRNRQQFKVKQVQQHLHKLNSNNNQLNKNNYALLLLFIIKQQNLVYVNYLYIMIKRLKNVFLVDKMRFIILKQKYVYVWMGLSELRVNVMCAV